MSALPVPETIDLTDSGDEGAGSPVRHATRSQGSPSKRKTAPIDLTDSDDEGPGSPPRPPSRSPGSPSKRKTSPTDGDEGRSFKKSRSPTTPIEEQAVDTATGAAVGHDTSLNEQAVNTTSGATVSHDALAANVNATRNKALHDLPELAPRFHTTYSTEEQVEYKNPEKFSIKPAFFVRWQPHDYVNLAEHMRYQFDPVPFARASNKPVEEVSFIAARLVFNPLYDASEAMKLGETAIQQILAMFKKCPTPSRVWAGNNVKGELDGIRGGGSLRLILEDGSLKYLKLDEMDPADKKYLNLTLSKGDWMLFYGRDEEAHDEMTNKMKEAAKKAKKAKEARPKKNEDEAGVEAKEGI